MPSKREISTNLPENIPPYTPMSSLGHELGILFGFVVACFVVMAIYIFLWRGVHSPPTHPPSFPRPRQSHCNADSPQSSSAAKNTAKSSVAKNSPPRGSTTVEAACTRR